MKTKDNKNKKTLGIFLCAVALTATTLFTSCSDGGTATKETETTTAQQQSTTQTQPTDVSTTIHETQTPETTEPTVTTEPTEELTQPVFNPSAPAPLYTQQQLEDMYPDTVLKKGDAAGQDYIDKIVFVGDSTTHGLAYYEVLKGGKNTNQVWTPANGTLAMWNLFTEKIVYPEDGTGYAINDAVALMKPEIMILTLGVNGVSSLSEDEFKGYYIDLIDSIKQANPSTSIILQSIYPVAANYEYVKSISMEKINTANSWIAAIAADKDVHYLNTISVLVDESGYIPVKYTNGDGIHLSAEGFDVILEYIKQHPIK